MIGSLSSKLILGVGSVAFIIIGGFSFLIHKHQQDYLKRDMETQAYALSETIKSSTHHDMLINQRESVHAIIGTIGNQEGIDKVRIFNKVGEVIFSTHAEDLGHLVDKRTEACYGCHAEDQPLVRLDLSSRTRRFVTTEGVPTLGIVSPIYNEPGCWESSCHAHSPDQTVLGVLDITMSMEQVVKDGRDNFVRLVSFALVAIAAISLMIMWLVNRTVLKPVRKLVEATKHVGEGDMSHSVQIQKGDEIGELGQAFNDMTQKLGETQKQLIQSNRLSSIGELAAGVAHEVNNPLTGVLTYSSLLLKQAKGNPELEEDLGVIVRETIRCREIVKGLLDFSRQSFSERRPMQLNDAVHSARRIVQNQLSIQNTQVVLELDEQLPQVNADMTRMQQVLVNLLVNAGDAMQESGGTIIVRTDSVRAEEDSVRLQVVDQGSGISPENLDRIFEPFFSTKGMKGYGLGLAIVWGIIERHEGRLKVDSIVGTGTTFTILLPAVQTSRELV